MIKIKIEIKIKIKIKIMIMIKRQIRLKTQKMGKFNKIKIYKKNINNKMKKL